MSKDKNKILIVDDIKDVREGLSTLMNDEGYNVISANNGIEALKQLETNIVSLIITDIFMPKMDGIEFISKTKELYPNIKFILISGGGSVKNDYDALNATSKLTGEKNTLNKPFKPQDLINMVKSLT